MWRAVIERFERHAPASVMARLALERALPAQWIDEVFDEHRQRQYPRELLFSTVVELMTLVTLGLRPSLHAAARQMDQALPVSLAALYDKVNRTEPAILRALVQGSAQRLVPVAGELSTQASLPGWQLRVFDGNHLPASEKRLAELRGFRGAALPGHTLVVYDPDSGLVCDIASCEDAHESERTVVMPLLEQAKPKQVWIGDRHFCTHAILQRLNHAGAGFIVREHSRHPRLAGQGRWSSYVRIETGRVREQRIDLALDLALDGDAQVEQGGASWRCIEIELDKPTESGDHVIRLWSNLPASIDAATIARLYRKRWRIEGMFQRLESVLHSEIKSLGRPRAALLGFAVAVLAYNVLALLQRVVAQAHRAQHPALEVSTYHLAQHIKSGYEGLTIALPPEHWPHASQDDDPKDLLQRLLRLARHIPPKQLATSKRGPKIDIGKGYVDGKIARSHASTDRVLKGAVTP